MITLQNVHKAFDGKSALQGVDLHIETGCSMVIIGGSGAGKSVLIKCILGLLTPDAGEVLIDGTPMTPKSRAGNCQAGCKNGSAWRALSPRTRR